MYQVTIPPQHQPQTEIQIAISYLAVNLCAIGAGIIAEGVARKVGAKRKTANKVAAITADLTYRRLSQGLPPRSQYRI